MADEAIPAATLIVARDRAVGPPELLMVERAEGMAFAAGALVFPGGRIDEADRRLGEELSIDPHAVA
ncbi:MAG: NUDIX hydrolase, partial [Sphingomicrobium sp.]